jgi:phospholipase/lecithinase/hemolysin
MSKRSHPKDIGLLFIAWNDALLSCAKSFAESAPDAAILVFSSRRIITEILDDPQEFGLFNNSGIEPPLSRSSTGYSFVDQLIGRIGGSWSIPSNSNSNINICEDNLHLSREVHTILAQVIASALALR